MPTRVSLSLARGDKQRRTWREREKKGVGIFGNTQFFNCIRLGVQCLNYFIYCEKIKFANYNNKGVRVKLE